MNRWRLHRGGIVNIWQYTDQEFDFSGGRVIFQGTNGSGKSRTLELLLPLCLDGELRQLGSKGFDTVSIKKLMLDDYTAGPNRIGYAWVELRREGGGENGELAYGEPEYLTCGIGVKASKTSQQVTDSWRFITGARVGMGVDLAPDDTPLSAGQLRELLGADCVFEEAGFRARIAETVYGVPVERYRDLLHLQRTLRNPDVGLKVLEGQLEQILSDALPPLEVGLIEQLATSFDDLESIRENIVRLSTADIALGTFLDSYSGYARSALRGAAERWGTAGRRLDGLLAELGRLQRKKAASAADRTEAETEVARLEETERELEARIEALKSAPAYQGLQDLQDRERLVASAHKSAESALDVASRQRAQEDRTVDSVLASLERLARDSVAADGLADQAGQLLTAAGLDRELCPTVPSVPPAEVTASTDRVRAKPDPEAEPLPIERRTVAALGPQDLLSGLAAAGEQAGKAATVARQRSALTFSLYQQAVDSDRARDRVTALHQAAREAMIAATEAAGRRNEATQRLSEAARRWTEQAASWAKSGPLEALAGQAQPVLPEPEALVAERGAARTAGQAVRQWATPYLHAAGQQVLTAEQQLAETRATLSQRENELAGLRKGREHLPPLAALASTEPDPATGTRFHQLVDFDADLSTVERAGLEAALQASGLLAAWVDAEGRVCTPGLAEVLASPAAPLTGRTLAAVLAPATEPDCPVPADLVARLLSSVALVGAAEDFGADSSGLAVSTDGRWRAGVLSGSWHKDAAEFVGAGARSAARQRRIAELEDELEQLRGRRAEAQGGLEELRQQVAEWERHLAAFPDNDELITSHTQLATTVDTAADAEQRARALREQHQETEQRWQASRTELVSSATEAGLSAETAALEQAHRSAEQAHGMAEQLREALTERCVGTVRQLADALHNHHAAVADRAEAEATAETQCAEYSEQATALQELTATIGGEAKEIAAGLSTLEAERVAVRRDLPRARERVSSVREEATKIETLLETKQQQRSGHSEEVATAEQALRSALSAPGVWTAAFTGTETAGDPPPEDLSAVLAAVAEVPERRGVDEGTVIGRLNPLQNALAGSHNITAETQSGILTVTVTSEDGPRPVAEVAQRVAAQLGEQRGYLGERYQEIFTDYLMRDLAERLRSQIAIAEDLCTRMNDVLDRARSSQGVHVRLEWEPSAALDEDTKQALALVRTPFANRSEDEDAVLRRAFTELIEAERDTHTGGYAEILARALDYRTWHRFSARVQDTGPDGATRTRRLRQLSSGETRLVSYVTLFAAAAAFYDAVGDGTADGTPNPLRLVLLDEAFERLDEPTIARMLGLLVDLDMDWIITWPSGWGVSSKIPRMHIYDVLRPKTGGGVACAHATWDGSGLDRTDH